MTELEKKQKKKKLYGWSEPFYETPEEMQKKIDEYFAGGYRTKTVLVRNKKGDYEEVEVPKITITDLVLYLGFADRRSFYVYEKKEAFGYTIKKARTFIEREYEEMLDKNPTGAIFALKNFGWTDKTEMDVTTGGDKLENVVQVFNPMTARMHEDTKDQQQASGAAEGTSE